MIEIWCFVHLSEVQSPDSIPTRLTPDKPDYRDQQCYNNRHTTDRAADYSSSGMHCS